MIPEKLLEVLKKDGVGSIVTMGADEPHVVNTWNSYVRISDDGRMLIPAGYMNRTEENLKRNKNVLLTFGSSKVAGKNGPGTGFLIKGTAEFITSGPDLEAMQKRFAWARATLAVTVLSATQTL
ncbi:MAG: pyridoxamine 5'-phosphate oxidase family protein [Deferrisomatales bacterium]|nr:pyridoxamine 5'-phosphate oxidase family protein [Deferrisomatales bacterium]